jgi:transmembrane sensor
LIQPGSNKAVLTLGDGRTIILDNAASGQLASESGTTIVKMKDGEIAYNASTTTREQITYNTIAIPRGGQYNLTLPDGTKVWLNAASTLRFPTRFTGNTREVELDGEAYFEVAKNQEMPFFVNAQEMKVKVLGTHFNVMAYKDEPEIITTLLEGKVKLSSTTRNVLLAPGEQGLFSANNFKVKKADLNEAVAWKNGYFIFNGENLSAIMRKISRWYDVDIDYNTHNGNLTYTGSVSRFKNISEVLKVLSLTGTVKFEIKERRVTVTN